MTESIPPGRPGINATWTSSAKTGAGTSLGPQSKGWFTISHGILDAVYFPFIDQPNIRDLGLLISDGVAVFSAKKRDPNHVISPMSTGVPGSHPSYRRKPGRS